MKIVAITGGIGVGKTTVCNFFKSFGASVYHSDLAAKEIMVSDLVLKNAIELGGSSIKDFSSSNGKKGSFQQHFNVYGKKGATCSNTTCKSIIVKSSISNRSTFFCNNCQK